MSHNFNWFFRNDKVVSTDKNEARFKTSVNEEKAALFSINVEENTNTPSPQSNDKSIFKTPRIQELDQFRMAIEKSDNDYAINCINENPRYLIGIGGTPSILQEETRYNALHVCARVNNAVICSFILKTIGNINFFERLYGVKTGSNERTRILLDLYLNTPDDYYNETPLHFACKFGCLDVVKALVLQEQCNRHVFNKCMQTPFDIVCNRAKNNEHKEAIISALEAIFFIPLLRSRDSTVQPIIGQPFTPSTLSSVVPDGITDVVSPRMKICALAGPMKQNEASSFRKNLKTPPRYKLNEPRLDPDKGLEKLGRNVAVTYNVPWKEYWEFLDAFVDLSSPEGLALLESYLKEKISKPLEVTRNRISDISFPQTPKRLTNGFMVSNNHIYGDREEHDKVHAVSPMSELCTGFESLTIAEEFDLDSFMINSYGIYAHHLTTAIKKKNKNNFIIAVDRLHSFIASCSTDIRLKKVNLAQCHSIIADIVYNCISKNIHHDLDFLKCIAQDSSISFPDLSHTDDGVCEAYKCIASLIIDAAERNNSNNDQSSIEPVAICKCKVFVSASHLKRIKRLSARRSFYSENQFKSDSSGCATRCAFSSNDSDDDNFMDAEECSNEYFLKGSVPVKLDSMVLEAIKGVEINNIEYPFIFFWKNLCLKYENRLPKHQWGTPNKR